MKNQLFLQGEVQGAVVVKVTDLIAQVDMLEKMSFDEVVSLLGSNEVIVDMVIDAMDNGTVYCFTHKSKKVKALICDALDSLLESEVKILVDLLVGERSLSRLDNTHLSDVCRAAVIGLYEVAIEMMDPVKGAARVEAGIQGRKNAEINASEKTKNNSKENVKMNNTTVNVGTAVGSVVTTKVGVGTLVGFENNGMIAMVEVNNEVKKFMADKVMLGEHSEVLQVVSAANTNEQVQAWEAEARAAVDGAIYEQNIPVDEQAAFDAAEDARSARYQEYKSQRQENAQSAANSAAAMRLLSLSGKAATAAQDTPVATGTSTRRPGAQVPTKNQTNGGNNMNTNTKGTDRPATNRPATNNGASSPKSGASRRYNPAANTAAPVSSPSPRTDAPATNRSASTPAPSNAPVSTGRGRGGAALRVGVGASEGTSNVRKGLGLKAEAPVVNNRTYQAWYMNERFENVISGEDFEETRKNEALGITHAIFWQPEVYNARFNRSTRENELAIMQVFVGNLSTDDFGYVTGGISIEFRLNYSSSAEAKSPWYCNNITFVENKKATNGGRWHYTVGKKADRYAVVVDDNYNITMATEEDVKNFPDAIQQVGDTAWTNERIYGVDISEEFIAQVMRWAAYGWSCIQEDATN